MLRLIRRLRARDEGTQSIELVLMAPLLFWAVCALYVFTDAFRIRAVVTDAAHVVSDVLSRQTTPIGNADIAALRAVAAQLTGQETDLRVTQIHCLKSCDDLQRRELGVVFSVGLGLAPLTIADLRISNLRDQVPLVAAGDRIIMAQTRIYYTPILDYGIAASFIEATQAVRIRFAPRLCWETCNDSLG
ncbi:TadE/TadG family type IV pilus assembly protein [Limimaricola soesokkakensis]|nr:hypothetical protein [Limimaricola soesokkakensis]